MTKNPDLDIPVSVSDYVKITSYNGENEPTSVIARISRISHVKLRGTIAVFEIQPNDRHSSPPEVVIPLRRISNTGFADLPLRLPNRNGWDYFQRLSSEDVPDEIKTRFSH